MGDGMLCGFVQNSAKSYRYSATLTSLYRKGKAGVTDWDFGAMEL
jgi:hypothetical protein